MKVLQDDLGKGNLQAAKELVANYARDPSRDPHMLAYPFYGAHDGAQMYDYWIANRVIVRRL